MKVESANPVLVISTQDDCTIEEYFSLTQDEEFNQLLEELSEIVYVYFCQLSEIKILAPDSSHAQNVAERSGPDEN